jgi:hypothetical protein
MSEVTFGQHGGGVEALAQRAGQAGAAHHHLGALAHRVGHVRLDLGQRLLVDQRALGDAGLEAVAHLDRTGLGGQLLDELLVHRVLHVQAVGADAGLAGVAVLADHCALDRAVDVGVVEDDEGRVAAQLQASFLMVGAHCAIRMRPTSVDPVKLRWRTTSDSQSTLPMAIELSASAVTMFSTPGGMPARWPVRPQPAPSAASVRRA